MTSYYVVAPETDGASATLKVVEQKDIDQILNLKILISEHLKLYYVVALDTDGASATSKVVEQKDIGQ